MDWWDPVTARPAPTLPPDFFDRGPASTVERAGTEPPRVGTTTVVRTTTTTTPYPWREAAAAVLEGADSAFPEGLDEVHYLGIAVASILGTAVFGVVGAWAFRRVTGRSM